MIRNKYYLNQEVYIIASAEGDVVAGTIDFIAYDSILNKVKYQLNFLDSVYESYELNRSYYQEEVFGTPEEALKVLKRNKDSWVEERKDHLKLTIMKCKASISMAEAELKRYES